MKGARFSIAAVLGMWLAAGAHVGIVLRAAGSPWSPNALLAMVAVLSLWTSRRVALGLGFVAGVVEATMAGTNALAYVATRMLAGMLAAGFGSGLSDRGIFPSSLAAAGAALAANGLLLFLVAPRAIGDGLLAALLGAATTGLVGGLLGLLLSRWSGTGGSGAWRD